MKVRICYSQNRSWQGYVESCQSGQNCFFLNKSDWLGIQGSNLAQMSVKSGAIVVCIHVSVCEFCYFKFSKMIHEIPFILLSCVDVTLMEGKGTEFRIQNRYIGLSSFIDFIQRFSS